MSPKSRDVIEARSGRGRGHLSRGQGQLSPGRGQGRNCINFKGKFYILTPFSSKKRNFLSIFDGASKISPQNGFNVGTLLVKTPLKRPATPLDAGYCFCVYTLNRKCHILSVSPLKPSSSNHYTLPYRHNLPFLISDIQALWRSGLSARVPECLKFKMIGLCLYGAEHSKCRPNHVMTLGFSRVSVTKHFNSSSQTTRPSWTRPRSQLS